MLNRLLQAVCLVTLVALAVAGARWAAPSGSSLASIKPAAIVGLEAPAPAQAPPAPVAKPTPPPASPEAPKGPPLRTMRCDGKAPLKTPTTRPCTRKFKGAK